MKPRERKPQKPLKKKIFKKIWEIIIQVTLVVALDKKSKSQGITKAGFIFWGPNISVLTKVLDNIIIPRATSHEYYMSESGLSL